MGDEGGWLCGQRADGNGRRYFSGGDDGSDCVVLVVVVVGGGGRSSGGDSGTHPIRVMGVSGEWGRGVALINEISRVFPIDLQGVARTW